MIKKPELISNKLPFERLAIGSAQFGFKYGIMNKVGQTTEADIQKILDVARNYRINTIDTAVAYGESEKLLGKIGVDDFNVMSKISFSDTEYKDLIKWGEDKVTIYGQCKDNQMNRVWRDVRESVKKSLRDTLI